MRITRRNFLQEAALLSLTPAVPVFLARTAQAATPERDGRVLVVIQLDGGNDGINTVVPFADEGYARHRPTLRLRRQELIRFNDQLGLHPGLRGVANLLESRRLAIIQGVGYPNPNRSHAQSMAIWQTARFDPPEHSTYGWLGRGLDRAPSVFVGRDPVPIALRGRESVASAIVRLDEFFPVAARDRTAITGPVANDDLTAYVRRMLLESYLTADSLQEAARVRDNSTYPQTELASRLQLIARLIKAGTAVRVFYTLQPGYDTHYGQLPQHSLLLTTLAGGLQAFLDDLARAGLDSRVCVLVFSEFGRRVADNGSGTDHGTAGPVLLAGPRVQANLVGTTPSLLDLENGDLKVGLDFRRVYASVLEDWLGLPSEAVLAGSFDKLPLFRT